ncbi:MAG: hypothetical protein ACYC99_04155 [Candidatus Geothermincolia bacterium]
MGIERCGQCGLPVYVRLAAVWNDDGTITGRFVNSTRVVQIYSDEMDELLAGISTRIGFDISKIIVEGERKAGVEFTRALLDRGKGLVGVVARNRVFSRMVIGFVIRASKNAGFGDCRVSQYRWNRLLQIEVKDSFNPAVLAGNMLGSFEAFVKRPATVRWEGDSARVLITIEVDGDEGRVGDERLKPRLPVVLPGDYKVERCRRCGMPRELSSRYDFDLDRGIATEACTGRRIVTVMIDSLNAVFKELESELGPEIPQMVVELEGDYVRKNASMPAVVGEEEAVIDLLSDLRIKGMGNPTEISLADDELLVRIENPFCEELLAGRILGFYKALLGEPAEVKWTPDTEGFMFVKVFRP